MMQAVRTITDLPRVTFPDDYALRAGMLMAEWYTQHGPIFRASGNFSEWVIMIGPEANRFVMSSNRLKFSHHVGWGRALGVVDMIGDGLLTMDGAQHDDHRRMMNPAFAISYMDRYLPIMNRIVRQRTADWAARGVVDVYSEARKITFDVAAEALIGLQTGPEVDRFRELFYALLNIDAASHQDWIGKMFSLRAELEGMLLPKIQARRTQPTDDVLGMMIQARDADGAALSDAQLMAHVNILLIAGHETSTSLAAWLLYLLADHTDYRGRVLAEQDALLSREADPRLEDIKKMKVLDNALSEAERLYPPVGYGPRGVAEDFEFNGYHIPAGTLVGYQIHGCHRLPSLFADPDRFDPDRFAPPREEDKKTPYALVGFGGGPRICIGINFAQVEIKALASHVVRQFTLSPVPGQLPIQRYEVTAWPMNGVRLHVRAR